MLQHHGEFFLMKSYSNSVFAAPSRTVRGRDVALKTQIPKECAQAYAQLLGSPLMSILCKNSGEI